METASVRRELEHQQIFGDSADGARGAAGLSWAAVLRTIGVSCLERLAMSEAFVRYQCVLI